MTIHAFTELHNDCPAFINLSEGKDGTVRVSVRSRGNGNGYAAIDLTAAQAEELANSIYKHLYKDEAGAPDAQAKPDLSSLCRYDIGECGQIFAPNDGSYVLFDDVAALLAHPVAQAKPEGDAS